jgi:pSer/pThr/pTyr-binding forkhead associated (FHA) protein
MSYLIKCSNCNKEKVLNNYEKYLNKQVSFTCSQCGKKVNHKVEKKITLSTEVIANHTMEGKVGSLSLLNSNQKTVQNYILTTGEIRIGRSSDKSKVDIQLPKEDKTLSRNHCKIIANYSIKKNIMEYKICDDASKNGIYINEIELAKDAEIYLSHGDIIQLGKTILKFELT